MTYKSLSPHDTFMEFDQMKKLISLAFAFLSASCLAHSNVRFFEMPIEQLYAKCNAGDYESCHYAGIRTRDAKLSARYHLKACYGDYGRSCYRASEKIIEYENPELSIHKLKTIIHKAVKPVEYGCSIGNAKSCRYLGSFYAAEELGMLDYETAKKHLKKGCLYGDKPSCEIFEQLKQLGY